MGLGFLPTGSQAGFVADDARGAEEMRHFRRRRRGDAADSKWAVNSPRERVGGAGLNSLPAVYAMMRFPFTQQQQEEAAARWDAGSLN